MHESGIMDRYFAILGFSLKWIYARLLVLYAAVTGKGFYCRTLTGESGHNTCINSDLTVSCNCNDRDGTGRIGDIGSQRLAEIFSGPKAASFREFLSRGRLPIHRCARCPERRLIKKSDARRYVTTYRVPSVIMVENTVQCNLSCLWCARRQIYKNRSKTSLSLNDIERVSRVIRESRITHVAYVNLGEPFCSSTIKQELEIIKKENPEVSLMTSTNGTMVDSTEKMEAALYFDHIYFSIDGSTQESVQRYQRGMNFDTAYHNMKTLVELRNARNRMLPIIEWKYVLFRWNDSPRLISKAMKLAREANVDVLSFWPTPVPVNGIAYLWYLGLSYARKVGMPSWKGREIRFRKDWAPSAFPGW